MDSLYDQLIEQSLQFQYEVGAISRVGIGAVTPWLTLPYASILYVPDGLWRIERESAESYLIYPGEASCIAPGVRHRSFVLNEDGSESRWAHFSVFLCGYLDVFSMVDLPLCFAGDVAQRLGAILAELAQLREETDAIFFLLNRKALEFEMAAILIRESTPKYQSHLRLLHLQRVLPALDAIHKNLAADFTRNELAALVHLSPSRFATVFKEAVGVAPIDYIVKLRMQRARQLLPDKNFSIEQIAAAVGYGDAFYFSRLFKTHFGFSPKKYRDLHFEQKA